MAARYLIRACGVMYYANDGPFITDDFGNLVHCAGMCWRDVMQPYGGFAKQS